MCVCVKSGTSSLLSSSLKQASSNWNLHAVLKNKTKKKDLEEEEAAVSLAAAPVVSAVVAVVAALLEQKRTLNPFFGGQHVCA